MLASPREKSFLSRQIRNAYATEASLSIATFFACLCHFLVENCLATPFEFLILPLHLVQLGHGEIVRLGHAAIRAHRPVGPAEGPLSDPAVPAHVTASGLRAILHANGLRRPRQHGCISPTNAAGDAPHQPAAGWFRITGCFPDLLHLPRPHETWHAGLL